MRDAMDERRERQFDELARIGYLRNYEEMVRNTCAPFWWSTEGEGGKPKILNNGTMCFLNTGEAHIGITADHVYAAYERQHSEFGDIEAQLGNNRFAPEDFLIDRDAGLDLATFRVPEVFVSASETAFHHNALKWPQDRVRGRDVLLHGGYPQVLRNQRTGEVDYGFQYFVTRVNAVRDMDIVLEPSPENVYWPGRKGESINTAWGGQSGGPVYRIIDADLRQGGIEVVDRVELVGFIYNAVLDLVIARHSDFVLGDGKLRRL